MGLRDWLQPRLLSVAVCILGSGLIGTVFNFYYVRVFKNKWLIDDDWVSAAEATLVVVNVLLEPFLGIVQDFGCGGACRRRRRVILCAGPFLVGSFLLPWFAPYSPLTAPPWLVGLHLVLVLMSWNFFFVLTLSAYCGLFAEVSKDPTDRARLFAITSVFKMLGNSVVFPMEKVSRSLEDFRLFQYLCLGIGALSAGCFVVTGLFAPVAVAHVTEREEAEGLDDDADTAALEGTPGSQELSFSSVPRILRELLSMRNVWTGIGSNLLGAWMRTIAFSNFLAIHTQLLIPQSVLGQGSYQLSVYFWACQVFPLVFVSFVSQAARRWGVRRVLMLGYVLTLANSSAALLLKPLLGYEVMLVSLFVEGLLASVGGMYQLILGEIIDQDTEMHARRHPISTFIFTLNGAFSRAAIGLAPIVVLACLNLGGYGDFHKLPAGAQPPDALKEASFLTATCYPAACAIMGAIVLYFYQCPKGEDKDELSREVSYERLDEPPGEVIET